MTDWLPGAERDEQGGGVTLNRSLPPRAVWHITWDALAEDGSQPDFDAVANYLKRMAYCPHLMWDPWSGRVVQFYPATVGGRALNAWNEDGSANIQIEVFFSPGAVRGGKRYDTVADTPCKGLAQILAWLDGFGIPRVWPMGAPQWQGNSRDADVWNSRAGHYGHCNVPDNTHTDPGPMPSLAITNAGGAVRPIEKDWFDMATKDDLRAVLKEFVGPINTAQGPVSFAQFTANGVRAAEAARDAVRPVKRGGKEIPVNQEIADAKTLGQENKAQIALLTAAVKALADSKGIDAAGLSAVLDSKLKEIPALVQEGIADGTVTVDVNVAGGSNV